MVVLPALSSPSMRMRIGALRRHQNSDSYRDENVTPITGDPCVSQTNALCCRAMQLPHRTLSTDGRVDAT